MLFDGVCNLCNGTVSFILRHERAPTLRFASLQSDAARALLTRAGLDPGTIHTIVLIEGGEAWVRSDAALRIAGHLRAPWRWGRVLRVVPRAIRDACYRVIATHRYRLFGRRDTCTVPAPEAAARFVDRGPAERTPV